jgi:polysaccharide deacetylase 2 family uncharacterized protein YibQ
VATDNAPASTVGSRLETPPGSKRAEWPRPLRMLAVAWGVLGAVVACGGMALSILGPPSRPVVQAPAPKVADPHGPAVQAGASAVGDAEPVRTVAARGVGVAIPPPDAALLEPSASFSPAQLPRVGADGRTPREAYAAGFNPPDQRPRVAMLVAGIGMSGLDTEAAISQLPAAVSLAITPYAPRGDRLLDLARAAGHELFISLALEPSRYPLDDPGPQTLLTTLSAGANALRLEWTLSRFNGYAGAIGALGVMRGERFAGSDQMSQVLQELAQRGLAYVDPRPDGNLAASAVRLPAMRRVDVVIDEPAVRVEIEARLARLEQVARDRGTAVGFAGAPAPVTLDRIAAWSNTLAQRGIVLVPVTSILVPPRAARPGTAMRDAGNVRPASVNPIR